METNNSWNLPDDPYERQIRVAEIADQMAARYDEIFFEVMNRILAEVRHETNTHESTPSNLAQVALTQLGVTRIQ